MRRRSIRLIARFDPRVRGVHHATAVLMLICVGTGACMYFPPLATRIGERHLLETIHIYAGFALPAPVLFGWLFRAFRSDVRRLNRFSVADRDWLRRSDRRDVRNGVGIVAVGKFNAGQKLNAAFMAGSILVMLGTGVILTWPKPFADMWRTGATFVHDWLFLLMCLVVIGHLWYALRDRGALRGMFRGSVPVEWAARNHPAWMREMTGSQDGEVDDEVDRVG